MRDLLDHPDFIELMIPRFARIKVNLMAAPAAIAEVTYRDTSELEAECALVAGAPFAQTFMTAASPGIVASAMDNRHYASHEEYVRAVADRTADRVPLHRRPRAAPSDRRPRSRHGAAHPVRRPSARRVPRLGRAGDRRDQRRADRHRPVQRATARVLGQLRGPAHARRAAEGDPLAALRSERRRAGRVDGERAPRPRVRAVRARAAAGAAWCSSPV